MLNFASPFYDALQRDTPQHGGFLCTDTNTLCRLIARQAPCWSSSAVLESRAWPGTSCPLQHVLHASEACECENVHVEIYSGTFHHKKGPWLEIFESRLLSVSVQSACGSHSDHPKLSVSVEHRIGEMCITVMPRHTSQHGDRLCVQENAATPKAGTVRFPWCWKYCAEIKRLHRGADCKQSPQGQKLPEWNPALY